MCQCWFTPENEDSFIGNSATLGYNFCKQREDDRNNQMGAQDTSALNIC